MDLEKARKFGKSASDIDRAHAAAKVALAAEINVTQPQPVETEQADSELTPKERYEALGRRIEALPGYQTSWRRDTGHRRDYAVLDGYTSVSFPPSPENPQDRVRLTIQTTYMRYSSMSKWDREEHTPDVILAEWQAVGDQEGTSGSIHNDIGREYLGIDNMSGRFQEPDTRMLGLLEESVSEAERALLAQAS